MTSARLVLFDDDSARAWRPFTLTRPTGELLFGTRTLRARAEEASGFSCAGHITAPHLRNFEEPWARPVLRPEKLDTAAGVLFLSSRFVPHGPIPEEPGVLEADGQVIGCRIGPGDPVPDPSFFERPDDAAPDLPRRSVNGRVLGHVWELMSEAPEQVARDLGSAPSAPGEALPAHVHVIGDGRVSLGDGVTLHPGIVLDTRHGPIRLEEGVEVRPFTQLAGPSWIGPGSTLLGGPYEAVTVGPVCKVHGEMEETVVLGYSNKAHDGFLGHAYLGLWVNLGALTTNSDLKNNYGTVRVWTPEGEQDTGEIKIGSFLGDHVKTAIGTMLNTGTVIEAGSNIFGGMPPKYVPPFSWGSPESPYDVERFLQTAGTVMGRRDVELGDRQRSMLRQAWEMARGRSA